MLKFGNSAAILAVVALSACGGSGGKGLTDREEVELLIDDVDGINDRLGALAPTRFDAMPQTGSAQFEGIGGFLVESDSIAETGILGEAEVTVDFREGTVDGTVSDFRGIRGDDIDDAEIFDVAGRVNIDPDRSVVGDADGRFGADKDNDWGARYSGSLTLPEGRMRVSGVLEGEFLGTRVNNPNTDFPIKGMYGEDADVNATLGDEDVDATFELAVEN